MAKDEKKDGATAVKSAATSATSDKRDAGGKQKDAIALLKADHRTVEQLFSDYGSADSKAEKEQLVSRMCSELTLHTLLEEQLFYPACREHGVGSELLDEAQVEHDGVKLLIAELQSRSPDEDYYDAKVAVLAKYVQEHIDEEEQRKDGIFAQAKKRKLDLKGLGRRLQERKSELMQQSEASRSRLVQVRSHDLRSTQQLQRETRRISIDSVSSKVHVETVVRTHERLESLADLIGRMQIDDRVAGERRIRIGFVVE